VPPCAPDKRCLKSGDHGTEYRARPTHRNLTNIGNTLWALDALSIPAMSTECGRVFSSAEKLLSLERNTLADNTIEACERLKAWWDQGLIRGLHDI
jgi:hypothetical protein